MRRTKEQGPVIAVLVGAGLRGRESYGAYSLKHPDRLKFIAVADPNPDRRKLFAKEHNIPEDHQFESDVNLFAPNVGKIADAAFICTPDRLHFGPAMRALDMNYDLVLEKPIAPSIEECQQIVKKAVDKQRLVQVCHVLRFTDFWLTVKNFIAEGKLGKVIHYDHSENVAYWHFGHSFVRGMYKNKASSTPIILAKTCHDLDIIQWILNARAETVQSIGFLSHYQPSMAPKDAPERCTDGCPHEKECPWYAPRLYLHGEPMIRIALSAPQKGMRFGARFMLNHRSFMEKISHLIKSIKKVLNWQFFPATHLTSDLSIEGKLKALREGPYGKCIYKTDNDVMDHQITTFQFPNGITAVLQMHGLSEMDGREIRIFGSRGVLRGYFRYNGEQLTFTDFRYNNTEILFSQGMGVESHGGGDDLLMDAFTDVMMGNKTPEQAGTTDIAGAMESHYMGFAGEEARITNKIQNMRDFRPKT